jgi:DNA-binding response OmpR family regulator
MSDSPRILVVDDEAPIRMTLKALLSRAGYEVTAVGSGEDALVMLERQVFDLMLCDLKMPGIDGMEVVRVAQERDSELIIIILTGHGSLESAIEGLRRDIFDYLLKTTAPEEVMRRVAAGLEQRARQRRRKQMLQNLVATASELGVPVPANTGTPAPAQSTPAQHAPVQPAAPASQGAFTVGPLWIDPLRQEVEIEGRKVVLTPTELRVLMCLARNAGAMLSYVQLVQCAHGYETFPSEAAELVKPHVHHLRQKLEANPSRPRYLLNVRGTGYMLALEDESQATSTARRK